MAKSASSKKQKSKLAKVCSLLVDIFVIPFIIIIFVSTILMFSAKANNRVPSIFGQSIVVVADTGSMEPEFYGGDVLLVGKVNDLNTLKVGDDIAFYAPTRSGYVDEEGNSLVILHRIVRILEPNSSNGLDSKYFVCKGINIGGSTYKNVGEGNGNYTYNEQTEKYEIMPGGEFEIVLEGNSDLRDEENNLNDSEIEAASKDRMQYIKAESQYVVGKYNTKLPSFVGGFIMFCSSSSGIAVLVIVPSLIMIALVLVGLIKEIKYAKKEDETDQLILESNREKIKNISDSNRDNKIEEKVVKDEPKEKEVNVHDVIGSVVGENKQKTTIDETSPKTKTVAVKTEIKGPQTTQTSKTISVKAVKVEAKDDGTTQKTTITKQIKSTPTKSETTTKTTKTVVTKPKPETSGSADGVTQKTPATKPAVATKTVAGAKSADKTSVGTSEKTSVAKTATTAVAKPKATTSTKSIATTKISSSATKPTIAKKPATIAKADLSKKVTPKSE